MDAERLAPGEVTRLLGEARQPAQGLLDPPGELVHMDQELAENVDQFRGGVGGAPKFPQPQILEQLWRAWKRTGDERFRNTSLLFLQEFPNQRMQSHHLHPSLDRL